MEQHDGSKGEEKSLYTMLGVSETASQEEIRKSYRKLCLQLHPDKAGNSDTAKKDFQRLQDVYAILSDPEKKHLYDTHGIIASHSESDTAATSFTSEQLYRKFKQALFEVTDDEIERFEADYRRSPEEEDDLLRYYENFAGDMKRVFAHVLCSDESIDSHRFADIIDTAINEGRVQAYPAYDSWRKRTRKRTRPTEAAERRQNKKSRAAKSGGTTSALVAKIQANQSKRSAVDSVAERWSKMLSTDMAGAMENELDEDAFRAAQSRLRTPGSSSKRGSQRKAQQR